MEPIRFDPLTAADLDAAGALSTQAGWNQAPADWRRLLDLCPGGCLAARSGGRLVGTATVASYGSAVHWVGMVLVDPAERGRGLGTALLERAIALGKSRGGVLGLDATDLGRPLYLKMGFVDVAPIDRWSGLLRPAPEAGRVEFIDRFSFEQAAALDREACGADRAPLLVHLLSEPDAMGWVVRDDGDRVAGYAILRPGRERWHVGPVVADETAYYAALLNAVGRQTREQGVLIDVLRDEGTGLVLRQAGLEVARRLTRMTWGSAQNVLMGDRIGAATAFEWG
jgi:GNAT superfamily N-acetyltransferase